MDRFGWSGACGRGLFGRGCGPGKEGLSEPRWKVRGRVRDGGREGMKRVGRVSIETRPTLCVFRAYSGMIASEGQTPAQVPQSMHLSGSMT